MAAPTQKPKSAPGQAPAQHKHRKRWLIVAGLVLLFFFGWFLMRGDAHVNHLIQEQETLMMAREGMPEEEYRAKWKALRAEIARLPREDRRTIERAEDRVDEKRDNRRDARYFAMSAEERKAVIDKEITRARVREAEKAARNAKPRPAPAPAATAPAVAGGTPPAANAKAQPANPPAKRPPPSAEQIDNSTRERLVRGTPQARAGSDQRRLDMAAARAQAGLPVKLR